MGKRNLKRILYTVSLLLLVSCNFLSNNAIENEENNVDAFYTTTHKGHLLRLPLIKPYELLSSDDGFTWSLVSPFNESKSDKLVIQDVKLVGMHDSLIVVYSDMTSLPGQMSEAWACIDIGTKEELVFTTKPDFEKFLEGRIAEHLNLFSIDSLARRIKFDSFFD